MKGTGGFWLRLATAWERRNEEADQWASILMALVMLVVTFGSVLLVGLGLVWACIFAAIWPAVWVWGLWEEGGAILRHEGRRRP